MPKKEKTEDLKLWVDPEIKQKMERACSDDHRPNMTSALNNALELYISPYRHLFDTMKNGVDYNVATESEYKQMTHAYDCANELYATLTRLEDNSYNCHLNALRDVIRDYVIPRIQDSVFDYEKEHYREINDDDFIAFLPWLEIPGYSEYGEE